MASLIPSCPVVCVLIQTHAPGGTSLSYRIIQAVLWPVITAALVVLFIFVFRQQIASLIDRIKAATIGPARLEMGDKVVAQKPAKPKEEGVEIALQESQVNTEALRDSLEEKAEAIRLIWQAYEALAGKVAPYEFGVMKSHDVSAQHQCYMWFIYWHCERVWQWIYGTQVDLLAALRSGQMGVDVVKSNYFVAHEAKVKQTPGWWMSAVLLERIKQNRDAYFEAYLKFLEDMDLVKRANNTVFLTPMGQAFLNYLDTYRYQSSTRTY